MNELITITEANGKQAVSAKKLYEKLGFTYNIKQVGIKRIPCKLFVLSKTFCTFVSRQFSYKYAMGIFIPIRQMFKKYYREVVSVSCLPHSSKKVVADLGYSFSFLFTK